MIFKQKLSKENWATKYQYGDETPLQTFIRVSYAIARVEAKEYGASDEEVQMWADRFLKMLVHFKPCEDPGYDGDDLYVDPDGKRWIADGLKSTPGGRITSNAGTSFDKATLLNCFINSPAPGGEIRQAKAVPNTEEIIDCSMDSEQTPDNLTNIFLSLLEAAETLKSEGGYGINFGFIRPRGTLIEGVGIRHPGVVSYMHVWDTMSEMIVKGDNDGYEDTITNHLQQETVDRIEKTMPRKGAMMGVLPVWHPDIEEFVRAKQETGVLTKFNISVLVDDAFMEAVEKGEKYDLHFDGKVYKRVDARELYDMMMECTYCVPGHVTLPVWIGEEHTKMSIEEIVSRVSKGDDIDCVSIDPETYEAFRKSITAGYQTGTKSCLKIKMNTGRIIECTPDHTLFKADSSPMSEVVAGDIEIGDWLAVSSELLGETESTGWDSTYLKFLGLMLGDGSVRTSSGTVRLSCHIDDIEDAKVIFDEIADRYDSSVKVYHDKRSDQYVTLAIHNTKLRDEIRPLIYNEDREKVVPSQLWNAQDSEVIDFLNGYFCADGHFSKDARFYVHCTYEHVLQDVSKLLRRFGLSPTICSETKKIDEREIFGWKIRLCVRDSRTLQNKVDFVYDRYNQDLGDLGEELVPIRVMDYNDIPYFKNRSYLWKKNGRTSEISQDTGDLSYEKVVEITETDPKPVFDITVEDYHNFVDDGGTLYHNCRAEPGILYFDNMNRYNPILYLGPISASNPCGEIGGTSYMDKGYEPAPYLKPYMDDLDEDLIGFTTVCLLGSINVTQYIRDDRTFDYEQYRKDVAILARFLENVNDAGRVPLPAYQWALENIRQYGMGLNGVASAHFMLGLRYGSDESVEFIEKLQRIKDDESLRTSALLAKERGPFPMYDERYLETPYFKRFCKASEETKDLVRKYGVRNAKRLTNPPLGNSSVICNMVSNGIDPAFDLGYNRTYIVDKWPEGLNRENVKDTLEEQKFGDSTAWRGEFDGDIYHYEPHNRGLCRVESVEDFGYSWVKEHYPDDVENDAEYLVTAQELSTSEHVRVQKAVQEGVDQSCSKTINLPNDYPFEDFKDLYFEAWKSGLVGVTTYRAGTMENVLESGDGDGGGGGGGKRYSSLLELYRDKDLTSNGSETTDNDVIVSDLNMPDLYYNGPTKKVRREGNKYYIHFSYLTEHLDHPVALWIHSNDYEEGEYVTINRAFRAVRDLLTEKGVNPPLVMDQVEKIYDDAYHVKLGKIISMALRHNISLTDVVAALSDIEGDYIATTLAAVRKFLIEQIEDGTKAKGLECASCGSDQIVFESGCDRCLSCGYSGCS